MCFWLRHRGKMQGHNFQVDKEPLLGLPLHVPTNKNQIPIIKLVNRILAAKRANPAADTTALEAEIDQLVYRLYGLTDDEIKIVEESVNK
jgi:adenine-specific DNA-methyltransferase